MILPIGVALGAGIGQALVTRRGARAVSAVGIAGLAVGFVLLARLPVHGSYVADLLPGFVLFGVPLGLAFTAYSVATLTGVASRDAGLASGLNNTFEQVGGAIGTALMATIADRAYREPSPCRRQPSGRARPRDSARVRDRDRISGLRPDRLTVLA